MSEQVVQPARIEIEGADEISLKQLKPEDSQAYFDLIEHDRPHLSQFGDDTAEKYPTTEAVKESIESPKNPTKLRFGIYVRDKMVGSINLTPQETEPEIGYWIGKEHVGHGYATDAVKLLSNYAFTNFGLDQLYGVVTVGNVASRKTLEKTGFILHETFQGRSGPAWKFCLKRSNPTP